MKTLQGLRTKPTVEAGLAFIARDDYIQLAEYMPGNGFLYRVMMMEPAPRVGGKMAQVFGCAKDTVFFTVALHNRLFTMVVNSKDALLHYAYVQEKLGCHEDEAVVLAELFAYMVGTKAVSCEEYARVNDYQIEGR